LIHLGSLRHRRLFVTLADVPHVITTGGPYSVFTFQLILHESGQIGFNKSSMWKRTADFERRASATIGVEAGTGFGRGTRIRTTARHALLTKLAVDSVCPRPRTPTTPAPHEFIWPYVPSAHEFIIYLVLQLGTGAGDRDSDVDDLQTWTAACSTNTLFWRPPLQL